MKERDVALDNWRELYDLAGRVKSLAPWTFMEETDIFGVEMPEPGRVIFVSVMGEIGEHFAVAAYPDAVALTSFWSMHNDDDAEPERVLEIPQSQLSFENKEHLEARDRGILKELGLTFKGRNSWPRFRSYRPGFVPWFLERREAETLHVALDQLLAVAPRLRSDPSIVRCPDPWTYLIRVGRRAAAGLEWTEEFRQIRPMHTPIPRVLLNGDQIRQCHALPKVQNGLEVDLFLVTAPIKEGKDRPFYPYSLLMVESESGAIAGQELLTVDTSVGDMWSRVPAKLVEHFRGFGVRPAWLTVRPGRMEAIMRPVSEVLGVELRVKRKLNKLDPAKKGLFKFLANG